MSAVEFEGWRRHFGRYPTVEYILALIWLTVARALGNSKAKAEHMGYWLETPEMRQRRKSEQADQQRLALISLVSSAYRKSKGEEG